MKKTLITSVLAIALVLCSVCALVLTVGAETTEPEISIKYCNLSFRDSICIKYAVDSNVDDVKLLIWTAPEADYVIGTQDDEITVWKNGKINGVTYKVFDYTKIVAKKMIDVIYARAYTCVDGVYYYSQVEKYSVLQYAYNKLGKTGTESDNEELKQLLTDMLAYGASAQKYLEDYKTDRLATDDWYQVKVSAGTLDDGCTHGLYRPGDMVTLIAPATDAKGHAFSRWIDSSDNVIATTAKYELTVGTANEVYTPVYDHTVVIDAAVAPTCNATGLTEGSHCSVCDEVLVAQETVAATGEHSYGEWTTTKEATATEKGEMERVCGCGERETKTIEKLTPELEYTLNDDGESYSVTGIGEFKGTELVIPDTYEGLPVTSIGANAFDYTSLTSITIPNSVKSIEHTAFSHCTSLTSITIPDSVTYIGESAFSHCTSLTNVTIPNNVTRISSSMFSGCSSLTSITIPNGVTSIGERVFWQCRNLTNITLPNSITSIGFHDVFAECPSLKYNEYDNAYYLGNDSNPYLVLVKAKSTKITSCDIHKDTKIVHSSAFYDCQNLTSIIIPNGVISIGTGAFSLCSSLSSITIPNSVTNFGNLALTNCVNLKYNEYDNAYYIGNNSNPYLVLVKAKDNSITSCNIHKNTKFIYSSAFRYCKSLTDITIPNAVTSIGSESFYNCENLTSITIPNSVTSIGDNAFYDCKKLTNITIPNSVTIIDSGAFYNCESIRSITIPNSVTRIGCYTFYGCSALTSITFEDTSTWYRTTVDEDWFNMRSGTSISVTNPSTNATRFTAGFSNQYLYKE